MKKDKKEEFYNSILKSQIIGVLNDNSISILKELANRMLDNFPKISKKDKEDLVSTVVLKCNEYLNSRHIESYSTCFNFFVIVIRHILFSNAKFKNTK